MSIPYDILRQLPLEMRITIEENAQRKNLTQWELAQEQLRVKAVLERIVGRGRPPLAHTASAGGEGEAVTPPTLSHEPPGLRLEAEDSKAKGDERSQENNATWRYFPGAQVSDLIGALYGEGARTIDRRLAVAEAAIEDPEHYGDLAEAMHNTNVVNPHYQRLRQRQLHARLADNPPPPLSSLDGPFTVIYADPPWKYEGGDTVFRWSIENHYPTMPLEEICGLDVPGITAQDAVLFLWTTAPKLADACKVVEAWGFDYRTNIIWEKPGLGMGHWARINHEHLIVARRGNIPSPPDDTIPHSVIKAPKGEHSEKPESFYDLIERMTPTARPGSRIELFARKPRPGWVSWGLDVTLDKTHKTNVPEPVERG